MYNTLYEIETKNLNNFMFVGNFETIIVCQKRERCSHAAKSIDDDIIITEE